ncbi:hypothetical protein LPJ73_004172, partial [Coemansia sp. RSA 2703]
NMYNKVIRGYRPDGKAAKTDVSTREFEAPEPSDDLINDVKFQSDIKIYEQNREVLAD